MPASSESDASDELGNLLGRAIVELGKNQPLAADAMTQLGAHRASAILAALKEAGVDPARSLAGAPEKVSSDVGKPVPLKLGLAAK